MRRQSNRLTVTAIKAALRRAPATGKLMLPDGNGLYLQIKDRVPSWIYRYALEGRTGWMGLGPFDEVSLADAREKADDARRLRRQGIDPLRRRRTEQQTQRVNAAKATLSFAECARHYIAAHRSGWKNAVHAAQWPSSLEAYAFPVFGDLPVEAIDLGLVLRVLEPIWVTKTETAARVRGRIEAVLDWAKTRGYRTGENPARWKGHLDTLLPNKAKVRRAQHHAALPYTELATFLARLRQHEGTAAQALDFLILTAGRTGEVLGARWDEIDPAGRIWTIPGERMKAGKLHRVPLSAPAVAILDQMAARREGDFVFPGHRSDRPLAGHAFQRLLGELGYAAATTVHGLRSSFRDWVAERTNFPSEVAEMALAHAVSDKVEAAYRRGDLFERRRQLAEAWARYGAQPVTSGRRSSAEVVAIGAR